MHFCLKKSISSRRVSVTEKNYSRGSEISGDFLHGIRHASNSSPSSDLRASLSGKDLPEDIKARLLALHEENVHLKEAKKTADENLKKAKAVSKSVDF